jgi:hypothetical protein
VFDFVEEPLDKVPFAIEREVAQSLDDSIGFGRDDDACPRRVAREREVETKKEGRRSDPQVLIRRLDRSPNPNDTGALSGLRTPVRANKLYTAKPDPVISAHVHHYAKSLRLVARSAIPKFFTLRIAASGHRFDRGPVERSALLLSGYRYRHRFLI